MSNLVNKKIKVDEIKRKFTTFSLQELCHSFASIVDMILYIDGSDKYWDITLKRSVKDDYEKILEFLSPGGVFLNFLLKDMPTDNSMISYQFPVNRLSHYTQRLIANNSASFFITSRLQSKVHASNNNVLFLNAFEYYMFSFFGYIYNPLLVRKIDWNGATDSIYCQLVFRYMDMFLFNDNHSKILMQLFLQSRNRSTYNPAFNRSPNSSFNSFMSNSLFNESMYNRSRFMGKEAKNMDLTELYFTETIVQVIGEYWLNFHLDSPVSRGSPLKVGFTSVSSSYPHPTVDQVCLVRVFLKNIYHFCYANGISHITPGSQVECEFVAKLNVYRQQVVPKFLLPKVYSYLEYCFCVWPVDLSFKIVLETWLSAIQPWRYVDTAHHLSDHDTSTSMVMVDNDLWTSFIKDNLDLYCRLLLSFIRRISKTDLTVLRNAQMLFRVAKVLHQSNIGTYIEMSSTVRSRVHNESLWPEIQSQAALLFGDIDQVLSRLDLDRKESTKGWVRFLWDSISNDLLSSKTNSERLITYLTQSRSFLRLVLNIDQSMNVSRISTERNDYLDYKHTQPEHVITYQGRQLTDFGRFQVSRGLCRLDLDTCKVDYYQRPVCSYEVSVLVSMCRRLSSLVCNQFQDQMVDLCLRNDFLGRFSRYTFIGQSMPSVTTPLAVTDASPSSGLSTWVSLHPPQLRIRFLASKAFLFWFMVSFLVLYLTMDVGLISMMLLSSILYCVVVIIHVLVSGFV